MKRFNSVLASMIVICSFGTVISSDAMAGAGTVTIGGPPCDVAFTNSGGPTDPTPNSITINNLVEDPLDPDCARVDFQNPATSFGINFAGNGTLTGSGLARAKLSIAFFTCFFEATAFTGTNGVSTAIVNATFTKASGKFSRLPEHGTRHSQRELVLA